ncbi:MAG: hypothetical protein QOI84_1699 [Solirubrobacterales bacterium]|jgi:MFS family permease|nr:hypothetical protein [Solirubrobacterales bacterium]
MADSAAQTTPSATPDALDRQTWIVAGVVILGAIMSILDTTVINVAIDRLSTDFEASLTTIQWVVTGYTLSLAAVIHSPAGPPTASARSGSISGR